MPQAGRAERPPEDRRAPRVGAGGRIGERKPMKLKAMLLACTVAMAAAWAAEAEEFKFAFQGDAGTLDPYGLNETFTLGFQGNIYEGLTRRGPDLAIETALAESWELMEPTRGRFHLRQRVKFHAGSDSTPCQLVSSIGR